MRVWILDRPDVTTVEKAAELAEEYASRHASQQSEGRTLDAFLKKGAENRSAMFFKRDGNAKGVEPEKEVEQTLPKAPFKDKNKQFEAQKQITCYKCHQPGHLASGCRNQRLVFSYVSADDENLELLKPFMKEFTVNGKRCRVLRDSAATMDVVHPSYVSANDFTGECAWIRQVVQEDSVCLPLAQVHIEGPFGAFTTEAAVSARLPPQQPDYDPPALIDACEAPQPNADGPIPESVADLDARTDDNCAANDRVQASPATRTSDFRKVSLWTVVADPCPSGQRYPGGEAVTIALRPTTVKAPTGWTPSTTTWAVLSSLLASLSETLDAFLGDAGRVRTAGCAFLLLVSER
ncbi:hypothetical protein HPB52_021934 [Rhipicephalus sanguineus]|uniref:CCHC-type domain-containing protein n=1 Tax=Rhipicephalus sanguineus TaxID=34632 RepID=A0A9D4QEK8_RHISA|nr:hypothetical protein HPB52_021934 [Rhipicephalus sanguineus]